MPAHVLLTIPASSFTGEDLQAYLLTGISMHILPGFQQSAVYSCCRVCQAIVVALRLPYALMLPDVHQGFPGGSDGKESTCNVEDLGLIPGLGRFPWRRVWQPTPVFLPEESSRMEEPGGLQSMGSQRVGHDWVTSTHTCMFTLSSFPWAKCKPQGQMMNG